MSSTDGRIISDRSGRTESRTSEDEIMAIMQLLQEFKPFELVYVLDLNSRYSMMDEVRVNHIAQQLRTTFGSNHMDEQVRAVLSFFQNRNYQPQLWHHIDMEQHLLLDDRAHYLEPFTNKCPVCHRILSPTECEVVHVSVCGQQGRILSGRN